MRKFLNSGEDERYSKRSPSALEFGGTKNCGHKQNCFVPTVARHVKPE